MSSVRAQAVDLLERWHLRDARYPTVGPDIKALVHLHRSRELADLEDAAIEAKGVGDLHRSSAYRELRLILERWRP